jgi:hypothetical protein
VNRADLVWDWTTSTFNYEAVFAATVARTEGGRSWVTEFAGPAPGELTFYSTTDDMGMTHTPAEDFAIVTRGLPMPYVTRMRTDLQPANLNEDLVLQARLAPGDVSNFVPVDREVNRPVCPTTCTDPSRPGGGVLGGPGGTTGFGTGRGDGICSVADLGTGGRALLGLLAALGLALLWRARRKS